MYVLELKYDNALRHSSGGLRLCADEGVPRKWTFIDASDPEEALEVLRLTALAASGCPEQLTQLPYDLSGLIGDGTQPLQLELVWVEHSAGNGVVSEKPRQQYGMKLTPQGQAVPLSSRDRRLVNEATPRSRFSKWNPPAKHAVFAYGASPLAHTGSDDFKFTDPFYQLRRIHSLFSAHAYLTDPVAFLTNLHYRAVRCGRYMPAQILHALQSSMQPFLQTDTAAWTASNADFSRHWAGLSPAQQLAVLPVLDATRHLHDALPRHAHPLHFPALMLLYRPEQYCPPPAFADWISLLDRLFPAMQFVMATPPNLRDLMPEAVLRRALPRFPAYRPTSSGARPGSSQTIGRSARTLLLVDVDSSLPNLALMKLAGYYQQRGYRIQLAKREAYEPGVEAVFASSVFNRPGSKRRLQNMQAYYGDTFCCGGSGIDIVKRLPREIEEARPDYGLYPELENRAIGFLTRGCPFQCRFCIVPLKEGKPRQVADLDNLTGPDRKKLILLDDNILAHPNSHALLQEMISKRLQVNFNQTLDLNLVDKATARLIRAIACSNVKFTRTVYHFSLNNDRNLSEIRRKYDLFNFGSKDNVEFICMYGFDTTLAQDLERFRFLRSLPGAYVFVQEYQPIAGGPQPQLDDYFPDQARADRYIDELVRICFPQNMKSMEKFYRWLGKLYVERMGTLHMGLVDTIFRYNDRFNRGRYIASLAGTKSLD